MSSQRGRISPTTNEEERMDSLHNALVEAWVKAEEDKEKPVFVPQVTWPEGTEYVSKGPFFDEE
jgi:hypothetical protein